MRSNVARYALLLSFIALVSCHSGHPSRIDSLIQALESPDTTELMSASWDLVELGSEAVPAVSELLMKDDISLRSQACTILGEIGRKHPEGVVRPLAKALRDPDAGIRGSAAFYLAIIGLRASVAIPDLKETLSDPDEEVMAQAADALAEIGPAAVPALIEGLKHKSRCVRHCAASALGRIGSPADSMLKQALKDPQEDVRSGAKRAIIRGAVHTLKVFASAQADLRANDRDENGVEDFWVGDVSGLYRLLDSKGNPIDLIYLDAAEADSHPLRHGSLAPLTAPQPKPRLGYLFRAIQKDQEGNPYVQDAVEPKSKWRNAERLGICAYPAAYSKTTTFTYIISETNTVWKKDTGGAHVSRWPKDPLREGWVEVD